MAKELRRRIIRPATVEEKQRHAKYRQQIAEELPEIRRRGQQYLRELRSQGIPIDHAVAALKAERERQGLSLADMNERTGIDRSALSRLENQADANPTVSTLAKYANALGKQMVVVLADDASA